MPERPPGDACTGHGWHLHRRTRRCRPMALPHQHPLPRAAGLQGSNVKTVTPQGSDANDGQQFHAQRSVKCSPFHHDASLSGHVRRLIE